MYKLKSLFLLAFVFACASKPEIKEAKNASEGAALTGISEADFANHPSFAWPTKYPQIEAYFGWRKKRMHDGLDLKAPRGTRIYAAADGEVIDAGARIRGYGKTILLDHGNGWSTLYAHLSKIKTLKGRHVRKGELIGLSGRTGRATGPHLHFEIRKASDPLDPLMFLPPIE